jgi:hypothetical protein
MKFYNTKSGLKNPSQARGGEGEISIASFKKGMTNPDLVLPIKTEKPGFLPK